MIENTLNAHLFAAVLMVCFTGSFSGRAQEPSLKPTVVTATRKGKSFEYSVDGKPAKDLLSAMRQSADLNFRLPSGFCDPSERMVALLDEDATPAVWSNILGYSAKLDFRTETAYVLDENGKAATEFKVNYLASAKDVFSTSDLSGQAKPSPKFVNVVVRQKGDRAQYSVDGTAVSDTSNLKDAMSAAKDSKADASAPLVVLIDCNTTFATFRLVRKLGLEEAGFKSVVCYSFRDNLDQSDEIDFGKIAPVNEITAPFDEAETRKLEEAPKVTIASLKINAGKPEYKIGDETVKDIGRLYYGEMDAYTALTGGKDGVDRRATKLITFFDRQTPLDSWMRIGGFGRLIGYYRDASYVLDSETKMAMELQAIRIVLLRDIAPTRDFISHLKPSPKLVELIARGKGDSARYTVDGRGVTDASALGKALVAAKASKSEPEAPLVAFLDGDVTIADWEYVKEIGLGPADFHQVLSYRFDEGSDRVTEISLGKAVPLSEIDRGESPAQSRTPTP